MNPKETILSLMQSGHSHAELAEGLENARDAEAEARRAIGYFNAANALLNAFGELHNELIEHPQFLAARRFQRKFCL